MKPYYSKGGIEIFLGDCKQVLRELPSESVQCCVTSPPYWGLRDYGVSGQLGLEKTPQEYVSGMVEVFREVRRVLKDDGTLWLNLGDTYAQSGMGGNPEESAFRKQATNAGSLIKGRIPPPGLKPKDLVGIPWRVAFALQADGWYLRSDIIWHKPNPMPESVTDRPTKAHEYLFLLSKSERYHYDADAIREPHEDKMGTERFKNGNGVGDRNGGQGWHGGNVVLDKHRDYNPLGRNRRSVWTVATAPYSGAHFATFPPKLIEPCIKAGCPQGGTVLDPFNGACTTGLVAREAGCKYIGIELNEEYIGLSAKRLEQGVLAFE